MGADQRRKARIRSRRKVQLHVRKGGTIDAMLCDISKSGVAVDVEESVEVGALVRIVGDGFTTNGRVRNCRPQLHGYRLGISRFMDGRTSRGFIPEAKEIGRFMVSDPSVCLGQPIFRGTRVPVMDVLRQVASGMDWNSITRHWGGGLRKEAIAEAVGMDDFLPYQVSEIGGGHYLNFLSNPFGPYVSSVGKGVLVDTNSANDVPGEEPWVQRMIRKNRVSGYGPSQNFVDALRTGDTVFYFQKGCGILAAATITGAAARRFQPDAERYWDVRFLTATPAIFEPPYEALTVSEIRETLGFNLLWARTLKVPYLDREQTGRLLQAVVAKIGPPAARDNSENSSPSFGQTGCL